MTEGRPRPNRRAAQVVQQDQTRATNGDLFDAYPDAVEVAPRIRLYLVAFREDGDSQDGEAIDTDGLDVAAFLPGLTTDTRRRWLASRVVEAHARLVARLEAEPG